MLLYKRISGQHRHSGDDNDRHFDRLGWRHNIYRGSLGLHPAGHNNDLAQQHLDRPFGRIIHIEDRVHVRIPVSNRIEQGDGGDGRQGQRQHDPHEDSEVIASVDLGGLLQTVRQRLEEVAHDNHVEGIDGNREDQGPVRVDQADAFDDQEGGDHSAAEQHGEDDDEINGIAGRQVSPGQAVGHQRGKQHTDYGSCNGDTHGYPESPEDGRR